MDDDHISNDIHWGITNNDALVRSLNAKTQPSTKFISKNTQFKNNETKLSQLFTQKKYIPGKVFFPLDKISMFSKMEQALFLNALMQQKSGKKASNIQTQKDCQYFMNRLTDIKAENEKFLKYAKQNWYKQTNCRASLIKQEFREYGSRLWKNNLKRVLHYPRFYKSFRNKFNIPLNYSGDMLPVDVKNLEEVLWVGETGLFAQPIIIAKQSLNSQGLPPINEIFTYDSKLSVSQDDNIKDLLKNNDFEVVISSSGLKRFLNDADFNAPWDIPVVVKRHEHKKIVYIDKPTPNRSPTNLDLNRKCFKRLIKTQYCQYVSNRSNKTLQKRIHPFCSKNVCVPKRTSTSLKHYSTDDCELCKTLKSKGNAVKDRKLRSSSVPPDYTWKLPYKPTKISDPPLLVNNKLYHNATYKTWSIKPKNFNIIMKNQVINREIKFLVRCKLDACRIDQTSNQPVLRAVVLEPKFELQAELGGGCPTKSEIMNQWTSLFFRPYSELCRVRLMNHSAEIVAFDRISFQDLMKEACNCYKDPPANRLGILHQIFSKLLDLEEGNYLLHHMQEQGPFMEVLKAQDDIFQLDNKTNIFDFYKTYDIKNLEINTQAQVSWCPIDVNYILPQHHAYKRMPGLFTPAIIKKPVGKKKNKSNKKKKTSRDEKSSQI